MNKTLKYVSLLLAVIFLITGTMLIVGAVGEEGAGGGEAGGGDSGVVVDNGNAGGGDAGASGDAGGYSGGGDAGGNSGGVVDNGGYSGGDSGVVDNGGNSGAVDNGGSDYDYNSGGYYVEDYNNNYDSNQNVYNGGSDVNYNVADSNEPVTGSVKSNTPLYNSSGMSAEEAAPNEWTDITLDEKTVTTGAADFSSIKSNTETTDNGNWILYLGYALLGLSALGILYFIIATIVQRKKDKKAERMERRRAPAPRTDGRDRRETSSARPRTSRFADEDSYSRRRTSSRADTGEVYVPRRTRAKKI